MKMGIGYTGLRMLKSFLVMTSRSFGSIRAPLMLLRPGRSVVYGRWGYPGRRRNGAFLFSRWFVNSSAAYFGEWSIPLEFDFCNGAHGPKGHSLRRLQSHGGIWRLRRASAQ